MKLVDLVTELANLAYKVSDPANARVLVRWYGDDGETLEREIEWCYAGDDQGANVVVLHVPRPAQLAGEPGAGDVIDESTDDVDVDLLLEYVVGNAGCACPEGRCMCTGDVKHPECRERLAAELRRVNE